MPDIVKNLNYSAEEINDILASVSTKARTVDLEEVRQDVAYMTNLMHDYMEEKNTKFEELEGTVGSFQEQLTNLSTNHTTLSENFTTKSTEIDEKFTSIDSDISSINEDITGKADIATTLAGYGILDAKIEGGVITLGEQSITPITEHQDISGKANVATTLKGYGILDAKIEDGTITLGTNSITPLVADDIVGKAESSKVQELEQKISDLEDKLNAAIVRIAALEGTAPQEHGEDAGESNPQPGEEQTPEQTVNGEGEN